MFSNKLTLRYENISYKAKMPVLC